MPRVSSESTISLRSELEDAKVRMHQGSLVQPAVSSTQYVSPDRAPGIDHARIAVASAARS